MSLPPAEYKCMNEKCRNYWFGYRIMHHWCVSVGPPGQVCPPGCRLNGKPSRKLPGYGMTECIKCKGIYVEWLNWEECRKALGQ